MQVAKTDKQRLQDENKVLTDRNKKLLEELSDNIEDTTEQEILANRNANAIKDGPKLSYDEMNKRMKEAQEAFIQHTKSHEAAQAEWHKEMQVTRDLNEQLMDDRERQTERQEKHVKFGE